MTPDNGQSELALHDPITEDNILRALTVFMIPPIYDAAYSFCVSLLEPDDNELKLIEKCVRDWCKL